MLLIISVEHQLYEAHVPLDIILMSNPHIQDLSKTPKIQELWQNLSFALRNTFWQTWIGHKWWMLIFFTCWPVRCNHFRTKWFSTPLLLCSYMIIWYVKHITHAYYNRQETEALLWEFQIGWNEKRTADPEPGYLSVLRLLSPYYYCYYYY